ncbi:hypothetical protein H2248_003835 [Termitomyces sp. 'cryptogamus']|nr:hypothetical protein H2248_003835 [Termitomyces sp. 'cryptogamus']
MTWQSVGTILLPPLLGGSAAHIVYRWWEPRQLYLHFSLLVVAPLTLTPYLTAYFSHALLAALSAWVCYLASLVACTVLYRVSPVHPLAKYPGPLPCKITKLYFAIVAFGGKQHKWYNELHRRYGDVVRIGPNELSFCSPDLIAPGLGSHGMPKSAAFDWHSIDPDCKIMVAIRNPPQHAKVRRVWARGFTPEALRAYHPILDKRTEQLLNHLGERTGQAIDLSKWLTWFTHDVVNDMAFGDDLDTMQNKDSQAFLETIEDAISFGIIIFHLPWAAPFMRAIPVIAKKSKAFHNACYTRIKKRLEAGSESGTQDLIYHLMGNGRQGSTTLDINQLVSDSPLIVGAGSDTTSLTLSTLFYFLLDNPVAYSRLQAEIDDSKLAWNDPLGLTHLEYLNAAINEALRILPAIPSGSSRAPLIGSGGIALGSHFLPEGTTASIHTYTLHRDP